jgi:LacI family transcriptional regulator
MRQIAERADVSIGTVSHVINGTAKVRDKLRLRVLEAIRSLGYHPSQLGRGLRRNQTSMLGMIIPDITNPFFPAVVRGVEDVAYKRSYRVVLCNTDNDPKKEISYLNDLRAYSPAGLLVIPAAESHITTLLRSVATSGPPVVCIDRRPTGWNGDVVVVANEEGSYAATQHLLRMGHRHVAVIPGSCSIFNAVERQGFRRAPPERVSLNRIPGLRRLDRRSGIRPHAHAVMVPACSHLACNDLMALGCSWRLASNLACPMICRSSARQPGFLRIHRSSTDHDAPAWLSKPGHLPALSGNHGLKQRVRCYCSPAKVRLRAPPREGARRDGNRPYDRELA